MSWSDLLCPARADIDLSKIQRRLERKLAESAAATSQLRLRTRENRDLETQNMRLRHRQVLHSSQGELVWRHELPRQQSYVIKNQLGHTKPQVGVFG